MIDHLLPILNYGNAFFATHGHSILSAQVNLGTVSGGSADTTALGGIDTAINSVTDDVAMVVGPMGALGMTVGALGHTQVFHSPQLKEHSKEIMKYSGIGIVGAILAPLAIQALTHI